MPDQNELDVLRQRLQVTEAYLVRLEAQWLDASRKNLNHEINIDLLNATINQQKALIQQQAELLEMAADKQKTIEELQKQLQDVKALYNHHDGPDEFVQAAADKITSLAKDGNFKPIMPVPEEGMSIDEHLNKVVSLPQ